MEALLLVGIGSAIGGISRYLISLLIYKHNSTLFPWSTLVVNWTGCFLMGILYGVLTQYFTEKSGDLRLLLLVGFLGGYTTFSAFALEMFIFLEQGQYFSALQYSLLSVVGCVLTLILGVIFMRLF